MRADGGLVGSFHAADEAPQREPAAKMADIGSRSGAAVQSSISWRRLIEAVPGERAAFHPLKLGDHARTSDPTAVRHRIARHHAEAALGIACPGAAIRALDQAEAEGAAILTGVEEMALGMVERAALAPEFRADRCPVLGARRPPAKCAQHAVPHALGSCGPNERPRIAGQCIVPRS